MHKIVSSINKNNINRKISIDSFENKGKKDEILNQLNQNKNNQCSFLVWNLSDTKIYHTSYALEYESHIYTPKSPCPLCKGSYTNIA